jgi:hypothetical protein
VRKKEAEMKKRIAALIGAVSIVTVAFALLTQVSLVSAQVIPAEGFIVEVFAAQVQPVTEQGPLSLAFDSQGNLYIAPGGILPSGGGPLKILKIPAGSNIPEEFGGLAVDDADGVAVDSLDNVIVSGELVTKLDSNGNVVWQQGGCNAGNPSELTTDSNNNIYVGFVAIPFPSGGLGTQICKISPDGLNITLQGTFDNPFGVAVSPDGFLFVSQIGPGTRNIVKAALDTGAILNVVVSGVVGRQPVFDAAGDLIIADGLTGRILKISTLDSTISTIASGFANPAGLAFDANGNLFVSDSADKVIYKISRDVIQVDIDIKPESDPNFINPRSNGVIPVALLTTSVIDGDELDFDAKQVDPLSVQFGPNGASESHGRGHIEDVDGDGDDDLLLHFDVQATGIQCGDSNAILTGETFSGRAIEGSDSITTIGC